MNPSRIISVITGVLLLAGVARGGEGLWFDPQDPLWQRLPDMPAPVLAAAVSTRGEWAVVTGGIHQTGATARTIQLFDLKKGEWLPPQQMNTGRCLHAQVTLRDGRIFIAGGQTGMVKPVGAGLEPTARCELIDPDKQTVVELPPMSSAIAEPTAHELPDGRVMVIGDEFARLFDPASMTWDRSITLREPRVAHSSLLMPGGRVLVIGGTFKKTIELIDPQARLSRMLASELPDGVDDTAAVLLPDGRVWVLGGQYSRNGDTTDQTWIIDLSDEDKSTIKDGPRMGIPDGVADARVIAFGDWAVLAGGESQRKGGDVELNTARLLDLKRVKVHPIQDMSQQHDDAMAVADGDGLVVFGGFTVSQVRLPGLGGKSRAFNIPTAVPTVEKWSLPAREH